MNKYFFIVFFIALFSCSSEDDEQNNQPKSTIIATIYTNNNHIAEGAKVFTDPETAELISDSFGQVIFENLTQQQYDVYSYIEGYGSGKTVVYLGESTEYIDLNIISGNFIAPSVGIVSPNDNSGYSATDTVEFAGIISDVNTPINELTYNWSSNIDGDLPKGSINNDGHITLSAVALSEKIHVITLSVTNNLGVTSSASININMLHPKSIQAELTDNPNQTKTISWTPLDTNIKSYEVYRYTDQASNPVLIASLDSQNTNYTDDSIPFANELFYFVTAINTSDYKRDSNIVSSTGNPIFNIYTQQIEISPTEPIIYLRSYNDIIAINYETMEKTLQSSFPSTVGYFHIGNNGFGQELYIPSTDGWIYIHNISDFSHKESINVGVPVTCIISNNNGLLFSSQEPSPWWENPLRIFNRNTLSYVDGNGDFDKGRLKLLPSGNEIIEITTSISPIDMDYYKFDSTGFVINHQNDDYHGDHPLDPDIFKIAPQNNYLITSEKGAIYTADQNMTYKGVLPRGSVLFSDFEFNDNASVIYAASKYENKIYLYNASTLQKISEIETKSYPYRIFKKNNQLIVTSTTDPYDYYNRAPNIGIEIINL